MWLLCDLKLFRCRLPMFLSFSDHLLRKCMTTHIFLVGLYSTMVDTGMVLELLHLVSESICFCGAGGIQAFPCSFLYLMSGLLSICICRFQRMKPEVWDHWYIHVQICFNTSDFIIIYWKCWCNLGGNSPLLSVHLLSFCSCHFSWVHSLLLILMSLNKYGIRIQAHLINS